MSYHGQISGGSCLAISFSYSTTITDRRQHFDGRTVNSFMRQIFTALDHMHTKGVFHRDIKVRSQWRLLDTSKDVSPPISV